MIERFIEKAKFDWNRLSQTKRIVYGVAVVAAVAFLVLSLTGQVNLFDPSN